MSLSVVVDSPPPARGALKYETSGSVTLGLTPACAGSTRPTTSSPPWRRTHPRLRGEHNAPTAVMAVGADSPPPARGARFDAPCSGPGRGLTPACAGSTVALNGTRDDLWTHPRLRGEHPTPSCIVIRPMDSPPPARGAHEGAAVEDARVGLTPACAGSTWVTLRHPAGTWTHPRLRGEHRIATNRARIIEDSPPPARGARQLDGVLACRDGLTPACAGSTWATTCGTCS